MQIGHSRGYADQPFDTARATASCGVLRSAVTAISSMARRGEESGAG